MASINLNLSKDIFLPAFYPYITDYTTRIQLFYGGRASGKTYFCIQKLLIKGLKEKRFILLMNKQTNRVVDGVWRELNQAIDYFQLRPYFTFNKTEYRATCNINGTEFRCLGLQESERIKGYADISDVYMDEASSFTLDDFLLINGTLRSTKYTLPLQILLTTNPVSKANWVYTYFGFNNEPNTPPPNTLIHHSTYLDNPKADIIDYMETLRERNPQRYKIEALGEFASLDRMVYNNWTVGVMDDDIRKTSKFIVGLDFGYAADPTALVAAWIDDTNHNLYIVDEIYEKGLINSEIADRIISRGYAKERIIADSAEPKSIEELRRCGISRIKPAVKGKDSINHGIQKLQQYNIIVSPLCVNTITELENYAYQKDKSTNEYINKPIDDFNHALDALRYGIQSLDKGTLKAGNISGLGI